MPIKTTVSTLAANAGNLTDREPVADSLECWVVRQFPPKQGNKGGLSQMLGVSDSPDGKQGRATIFLNLPDANTPVKTTPVRVRLDGVTFLRLHSYQNKFGKSVNDPQFVAEFCEVLEQGPPAKPIDGKASSNSGGWNGLTRDDSLRCRALEVAGRTLNTLLMAAPDHPNLLRVADAGAMLADQYSLCCQLLGIESPAGAARLPVDGQTATEQTKAPGQSAGAKLSPEAAEQAATIVRLCVEMAGGDAELGRRVFTALTRWTAPDGRDMPGLTSRDQFRSDAQVRAVIAKVGPLHHAWKALKPAAQKRLVSVITADYGTAAELGEAIQTYLDAFASDEPAVEPATATNPQPADDPFAELGENEFVSVTKMAAADWTAFTSLLAAKGFTESDADLAARRLFGRAYWGELTHLTARGAAEVVKALTQNNKRRSK